MKGQNKADAGGIQNDGRSSNLILGTNKHLVRHQNSSDSQK